MIDFHVDVISKLCLWLSQFVFDWVDSTCWLFPESTDAAAGCHVEKRKKKVPFLWNRGREREKQPPPSSLTSLLVDVCVCVHVSVFLCANRQRAEADRARWLWYVMC